MSFGKQLSFLIITLIGLPANAQTLVPKNDLSKMELNGHIKSIMETEYKVTDSNMIKTSHIIYFFNELGYLVKTIRFDPKDGEMNRKTIYTYDDAGNLTERNLLDESDEILSKRNFKYDEQGKLIEESEFGPNNRLRFAYTYHYDAKGNCIEMNEFNWNRNGEHSMKEVYIYNKKGNMIEMDRYDEKDRLYVKEVSIYAAGINKIKHVSHSISDDYKATFKYNKEGFLVEKNWRNEGHPKEKVKSIYTLDFEGNWVKVNIMNNNVAIKVKERTIEYFVQ